MNILVTGATGFLGTHLCSALEAAAHTVVRIGSRDANLSRNGTLEPFNNLQYDQIYHLAAWTQAGDFCLRHPGEQWLLNQAINTNVLAWWQRSQPQAKLISIGTSCSYDPSLELTEENYLLGTPIESLYTYAMTKRMLLVGQRALSRQYGFRHLTLVPSTLYGPGYHTDGRQMHFIFDLIRKILRGKHHGEQVVLWGDGHQRRELVYVNDFVACALHLAGSCDGELVNIGAGNEQSIRDFARLICREVGYDEQRIQYDNSRYVGAKSKCLDIRKLSGLMPGLRQTPLKDGLRETIRWFEKHAL